MWDQSLQPAGSYLLDDGQLTKSLHNLFIVSARRIVIISCGDSMVEKGKSYKEVTFVLENHHMKVCVVSWLPAK